jgi:hypothetical protein
VAAPVSRCGKTCGPAKQSPTIPTHTLVLYCRWCLSGILTAIIYKLNVSGHMLIWTLFSCFGAWNSCPKNLPALFSYTIYIPCIWNVVIKCSKDQHVALWVAYWGHALISSADRIKDVLKIPVFCTKWILSIPAGCVNHWNEASSGTLSVAGARIDFVILARVYRPCCYHSFQPCDEERSVWKMERLSSSRRSQILDVSCDLDKACQLCWMNWRMNQLAGHLRSSTERQWWLKVCPFWINTLRFPSCVNIRLSFILDRLAIEYRRL